MACDLPPIAKAADRLLVEVEQAVQSFTRRHRYATGKDLRDQTMQVARLVNRAWRDRGRQLHWITELQWAIDELRLTMQLGSRVKAFRLGRCIDLKMWQDVVNVENRNGGKYDFGKEARMPYLMRLEMERTRRRIRDYLCNVFDGYTFEPPKKDVGFPGLQAIDWIEQRVRACWHYKPELGRRDGDDRDYNNESADCSRVTHGARVWTTDHKGRLVTGIAHYNINNMWWVVTGRYDCINRASFEIYTACPGYLRHKRNATLRRKRLEGELAAAVKAMNFERAAVLRDVAAAIEALKADKQGVAA